MRVRLTTRFRSDGEYFVFFLCLCFGSRAFMTLKNVRGLRMVWFGIGIRQLL